MRRGILRIELGAGDWGLLHGCCIARYGCFMEFTAWVSGLAWYRLRKPQGAGSYSALVLLLQNGVRYLRHITEDLWIAR
jgi:hypothetical protein